MHTEIDNDNVRQQFSRQTQFGKTTIVEKPAWNGDAQSIIIILNVYKESQSLILSLLLTVSCYRKYQSLLISAKEPLSHFSACI